MTDGYKTRVSSSWADNEGGVVQLSWLSITLCHGVGWFGSRDVVHREDSEPYLR